MKRHYFVLSLLLYTLISCDKNIDVVYLDPLYPDQEQFRSSVFVEVFSTSGLPVTNALVRIGNYKRETDARGFIYLNDVLVGSSTYLVVEKEGYFHASRRFYPTAGTQQFIRILMMPDSRVGFFSSSIGASLPIEGDVTLHFPRDGYEYLNGESYDGIVVVAAKAIPANDPDLSYKMPGDLTGIDKNGNAGSLASMGMVAVELETSDGQPLQLKESEQVQMDIKIASNQSDIAPSTIPIWHFDEEEGLWKEEGVATLSGNVYTAYVSHFSFWNYDAWFPAIKWGATFDFGNRGLASQLEVCITIISLNTTKCAYTNSEGMVCGLVAANELLLMEVKNQCGDVIYSEEIGPFADSTMLGPITISDAGLEFTTITGHAISCDGAPVTNGYASIYINQQGFYVTLDEMTGAFSLSKPFCDLNDVQVNVVDLEHNKTSLPLSFDAAPVIDADTISVCVANKEFIEFQMEGIPDHYYFYFPKEGFDEYTGLSASLGGSDETHIHIHFRGQAAGEYSGYDAEVNVFLQGMGWYDSTVSTVITVSEFGKVGEYINGTMSGKMRKKNPGGGGPEFAMYGSFSVIREE